MIAAIDGTLESLGMDSAIIKVGGISIQVYLSSRTISELGAVGGRVKLHTHLHWKEDTVVLYGFATQGELDLFRMLTSVSGVGPKLGLSMLSNLSPEELASAIMSDNTDLITHIPGVGKKTAGRIMLELKSTLEKGWGGTIGTYPTEDTSKIVAALTNLGYTASDAARAAAAIPASSDLSLEDKIRLALRQLAK
jgi:Holliday junction DNA helicase RuvA